MNYLTTFSRPDWQASMKGVSPLISQTVGFALYLYIKS